MQVRRHARSRVDFDALGRVHHALERSVDRDAFDVDLGIHLRGVSEDQLAPRRALALELSVLEVGTHVSEVYLLVSALVEETCERRPLTAWLHGRLLWITAIDCS